MGQQNDTLKTRNKSQDHYACTDKQTSARGPPSNPMLVHFCHQMIFVLMPYIYKIHAPAFAQSLYCLQAHKSRQRKFYQRYMRAQSNFHSSAPSPSLFEEQLAPPGPQTERWTWFRRTCQPSCDISIMTPVCLAENRPEPGQIIYQPHTGESSMLEISLAKAFLGGR